MGGKGSEDIKAHGFDSDFDTWESKVMLGEFRDGLRRQVFLISKGNQGVISIVSLESLRVVILNEIQLVEPWHDRLVDDSDEIRLHLLFEHLLNGGFEFDAGDHPFVSNSVTSNHIWEIEIHIVTRTIRH